MNRKIFLLEPPLFINKSRKITPRFIPYLLLSAATHLKKSGFEVKVYDAFLENASLSDIKRAVDAYDPALIVLFPADVTRFPPLEVDIELIKALKFNFPAIPLTVAGLGNESLIDKLVKGSSGIDYLVLGDPENPLVALADGLANNNRVDNIPGVFARAAGKEHIEYGMPAIVGDMDRLFFPELDLIDFDRYYSFPHRYKENRAYPVMTARGCPWQRCIFCKEISVVGSSPYRTRSPGHVVAEIEAAIKKHGPLEVQFYDANLNTDLQWLKGFHSEVKSRDLSFFWSCLSRVDRITEEAIGIMRSAGCWNITFGIESASQNLLDIMDKGLTINQIERAVKLCRDYGIQTTGSFLIGVPGEKAEDVVNSAKFGVRIGLDYAQFFIAKWHNCRGQFISQGKFLNEWDYSQFDFCGPVFVPNAYRGLGHLKKLQRRAYIIFYTDPRVILNHLSKINSLKKINRLFSAIGVIVRMRLEKARLT